MLHKDKIKDNTNFHSSMMTQGVKLAEVDPIFCKAFNVDYDADRATEIKISSQKTVILDLEFTEYVEQRAETPEEKKRARKALRTESTDSDNSAAYRRKMKKVHQNQKLAEMNADEQMLARDNLRIKSIAKYKTLREGDMHMFSDIENNLIDLATIKGKAFSDSSIEEKERSVESDLANRGLANPDAHYGRQSDNSERVGSVLSQDCYWQNLQRKQTTHLDRDRNKLAKNKTYAVQLKTANAVKKQNIQKFEDFQRKMDAMKKAHEIEVRNLRKTNRKAFLEFFKAKCEHVMQVFKQEQMYMVEEYFILKWKDNKKQNYINKQSRLIQIQERIISEMTCFTHDCLDEIFDKVDAKQEKIIKAIRIAGRKFKAEQTNDPFKLYQGYIDIVKPIEYDTKINDYIEANELLKQQLQDSNDKSDAVMSACEQYLKEEEELKARMAAQEKELKEEKKMRLLDN